MVYHFPHLETLRLALTSGAVPVEAALAPARASLEAAGIRVAPAKPLPKKAEADLRRLGVAIEKGAAGLDLEADHWLQLLPLSREAAPPLTAQTPVLFDLPEAGQLPTLVGEMLRLNNDRQAFRVLKAGKTERVLLRVMGPPYYTLLRALDRDGQETAPRAYVERKPRVWVRLGHGHPLLETIVPPPGQLLLLDPPRQWTTLPEGPFQDIYEVLEFALPAPVTALRPAPLRDRLIVPLRLVPSGAAEPAEMWVLEDRALQQVDGLVRELDDAVVARLIFAVSERPGQDPLIVLKVRPSKLPPPVLVLEAVGYRSYLKLRNLFVPVGQRLQPPLRRDALRKLLAAAEDQIVWLAPAAASFAPRQLPDAAFRPLADWVDYVLDHDHEALTAWMQSNRFDFEPFACKDDPPAPKPRPAGSRKKGSRVEEQAEPLPSTASPPVESPLLAPPPPVPQSAPPSEQQKELAELEQQFLDLAGPLDAPERQALWPRLGELNAALQRPGDAALCWINALWETERLSPELVERWRQASPGGLEAVLDKAEPSADDLRALAAGIVQLGTQGGTAPAPLLGRLAQFLERHEARQGVRPLWLAWLTLARLTGGDALALARARDRILERLLGEGLNGELNLPSFLRFERGGDRYWSIRKRLLGLRDAAHLFIESQPEMGAERAGTLAYSDLIFAFGLARLGEADEASKLKQEAAEALRHRDDIHSLLLAAFGYRIDQALAGKPHGGSLPRDQLEFIEALDLRLRYVFHRLQERSFILEPQERFNPYRHQTIRQVDALEQRLAPLFDLHDRELLGRKVIELLDLEQRLPSLDKSFRILGAVLGVAHRLGEAQAVPVLHKAQDLLKTAPEKPDPNFMENRLLPILERGLLLSAHYGQQACADAFRHWIVHCFGKQPDLWQQQNLTPVLSQCFRGLRKFGMRGELQQLLRVTVHLVTAGQDLGAARERLKLRWPRALNVALQAAGAWFNCGEDAAAWPWLDEARGVLLTMPNLIHLERTPLACSYVAALGQGPAAAALDRVEELFDRLGRFVDPFATNSHYSRAQLELVEAVVLAIVSDDFAMGQAARRWLDEDEYLVRRRIHRDVRQWLAR